MEGGEAPAGAAQATLLLAGLGGNPAPQQSVRLHRGTQKRIGILEKTRWSDDYMNQWTTILFITGQQNRLGSAQEDPEASSSCPGHTGMSSAWRVALLAVEGNFGVSLFSGAAPATDAHVQQSWLQSCPGLEGQTPRWCSFCFSSGLGQMKVCSGKFSAALTRAFCPASPAVQRCRRGGVPKEAIA